MKKVITYLLLLFYCSIPLRPMIVMVNDAIAHALNKIDHLATVHYENGRYHLHNELKALHESESEKEKTSKQSASNTIKVSDSEKLFFEQKITFPIPFIKINPLPQLARATLSGYKKNPYNPPKAV